MIFRSIVIALLGSLLVIEVTGQVQNRILVAARRSGASGEQLTRALPARRPANDNGCSPARACARGSSPDDGGGRARACARGSWPSPEDFAGAESCAAEPGDRASASRHRPRPARDPDDVACPGAAGAEPGETVVVDIRRTELDRLIAADPTGQARLVPSFRDGAPVGMKIYAIRPGSLFAALGFRAGDLVTSIDDRPVDASPPQPFLPLPDHATFVDITGRRDGRTLRIIVLLHP
jgi:hypothetical protein